MRPAVVDEEMSQKSMRTNENENPSRLTAACAEVEQGAGGGGGGGGGAAEVVSAKEELPTSSLDSIVALQKTLEDVRGQCAVAALATGAGDAEQRHKAALASRCEGA